ncbi:DNA-directed RNA polymerase II subunit RPB1 [Nematocida sp. LUAm3]|nr:DNA-directed RNA polymerase II subunit RPB1 [Nematocida sp. LUAm3]
MSIEIPMRRVESIEFGILSPEEIIAMSVCKVEHPETIESGVPKEKGLIDLRMGTSERGYLCSTCGHRSDKCIGHFGYIELAKPVYHIGFLSKIKKVLESVCFFCSKLRVEYSSLQSIKPRSQKERKRRLNLIWSISKNKTTCLGELIEKGEDEKYRTGCENKQPVIRKEGLQLLAYQKGKESIEGKTVLSVERVLEIFRRISDEDIEALGFDLLSARPEWMIVSVLPVPPPQVRPSIVMEGSLRCEDDLTYKLANIIKASNNLKRYDQEGAPGHIVRDYEQLLQFHVATLINNDISGQPQSLQKNGRPLKSIRARLRGKEGRVRGNLMGKRVDFSARTVITADPNISMNEVGVPVEIAKMLTFPEQVTEYNIEQLREAVHRGPHAHPGANYVIRDDNQRIDLRFFKGEMNVQIGYTVERHLRNGDIVLFNRQPSLHKMSMMAHRAKVMKYSTFRLNLSVTSPYNADFDGDEMNLHLPQSLPAQTELKELALVEKNIVSPQSNRPVMGIVQDTLLGIYKLTKRDLFLTPQQMMHLVYAIDNEKPFPPPLFLRPIRLYAGKQVVSHGLPPVFYNGYHSAHIPDSPLKRNETDSHVIIREGELISGIICKKTVGTASGGLIHVIANDYPRDVCVSYIDAMQRAVTAWLCTSEGFSVGIGDTVADPSSMESIKEAIEGAKAEVHGIIERAETDRLERLPGMSMRESFEATITLALNKARDTSGTSMQKNLRSQNNIKQMVVAGSKGSYINISQMSACVGQQSVEGKRILHGFRDRSLPHFPKDDFGADARGFVSNSYIEGLTPTEFFFHAMGGREGLIDTAVKTAETGYIQRRLVKAMEDAQVRHDRSIRDGEGHMIQAAYGGDCADATFIEMQKLSLLCSEKEFCSTFVIDRGLLQEYQVTQRVINALSSSSGRSLLAEEEKMLRREREALLSFSAEKKPLPVPLLRILQKAQALSESLRGASWKNDSSAALGDVLPEKIVSERIELEASLILAISPVKEVSSYAFSLFRAHLRGYISVKRILCEFSLNTQAFEWTLQTIKTAFLRSIVSPGEMVGTLAAQSIGEPATQMTLNTFHLAGVASTVTRGVPRLKEIINISKSIKTPSLTIFLKEEFRGSPEGAKRAQQEIERCYLSDLLDRSDLLYDPLVKGIEEDSEFIEAYGILDPSVYSPPSPWALRLLLNRKSLVDRGISISEVSSIIERETGYICMHSDDNSSSQVIRCHLPDTESKLKKVVSNVLSIRLKGLPKIKKIFISTRAIPELRKETEYVLQTEGGGLEEVLSHSMVDSSRSTSNDPLEVYRVLGIEAARVSVLNEIRGVIESDGSYVNFRHLSILADIMTNRGFLTGITRHGTNRGESGALMRCSFEETVEILLEAAANAEIDSCRGVVESIMLGKVAEIGTGITELLIDTEALKKGALAMEKYEFEEESGEGTPPEISTPFSTGSMEMPIYSMHAPSSPSAWTPSPAFSPVFSPAFSPGHAYIMPSSPVEAPAYTPSSPMHHNLIRPYSPQGASSQVMYSPTTSYRTYAPSSPAPYKKPAPTPKE